MAFEFPTGLVKASDNLSHQEAEKWCGEYLAADFQKEENLKRILDAVDLDVLDTQYIENCIKSLTTCTRVEAGFCSPCQTMLDNWPDFCDLNPVSWWSRRRSDHSLRWWCQAKDGRWTARDPEGSRRAPFYRKPIIRPTCHTHQLEASARQGCKFCGFLLQRLRDGGVLNTFRKVEARLSKVEDKSETTPQCSLALQDGWNGGFQVMWINLPGKNYKGDRIDNPAARTRFDSVIADDTGVAPDCLSPDTLDFAYQMLKDCSEKHTSCTLAVQEALPTRLVAVQTHPPRIVETAQLKGTCRYTTLSYSWGEALCLKLTRANVSSLLHEIPFDSLGQCFKDAITVTKRLNIEYLWIDALCIIQDDENDWEKEAATMYMVYRNSYLNIAASDVVDSSLPILNKSSRFGDAIRATARFRAKPCVRQFKADSMYKDYITSTHLASRAWAVQEKLLPSRTLHLGHRGGFWECQEKLASESLPEGFATKHHSALVCSDVRPQGHRRWWQIISLFSAAQLSFAKDKLPALSGIAQAHHQEHHDQYLAGMWRSNLEAQLCWRLTEAPQKRPPWRAPSWSWTSVDGPIGSPVLPEPKYRSLRNTTEYANVVDAVMDLMGIDPFGQVKGGCLRLSCSYILAGRIYQSDSSLRTTVATTYNPQQETFPFLKDSLDLEKDGEDILVYMLPMYQCDTGHGWSNADDAIISEHVIEGLVLLPSHTTRGQFHRIGSFQIFREAMPWHKKDDQSCGHGVTAAERFSSFLALMKKHGKGELKTACAGMVVDEANAKGRYIIEIV